MWKEKVIFTYSSWIHLVNIGNRPPLNVGLNSHPYCTGRSWMSKWKLTDDSITGAYTKLELHSHFSFIPILAWAKTKSCRIISLLHEPCCVVLPTTLTVSQRSSFSTFVNIKGWIRRAESLYGDNRQTRGLSSFQRGFPLPFPFPFFVCYDCTVRWLIDEIQTWLTSGQRRGCFLSLTMSSVCSKIAVRNHELWLRKNRTISFTRLYVRRPNKYKML